MEHSRLCRNISDLFKPNVQGLTTYDLTYVTAKNNEKRNLELQVNQDTTGKKRLRSC